MNDSSISDRIRTFLAEYSVDAPDGQLYWYPLCILKKDIPVAAYDLDKIYGENCIEQLEAALKSYGLRKLLCHQMQNGNTDTQSVDILGLLYRKDPDGYVFPWIVEAYYFDASEEWMIYVSHEGTVTFTGDRLVGAAREHIRPEFLY
jgi:hypothetical protein